MKKQILISLLLVTITAHATHSALTFRHRESQGVGYNQGYSTLDYYLVSQHNRLAFLLNLRGHLFNDAKAAGNGGIGFRYSLNDDSSRIGLNLFYDVRDTKHFFAQQVGSGIEWISHKIDLRLNGYLPIGKIKNFSQHTFQGFTENVVLIKRKFSAALPCMEGEIAAPLAHPFYFAAGTYYLFHENTHSRKMGNVWGWKVRFDVEMGDYFTAGALVTHDRIFNTRVQGYLALNIPLGPWKSMKESSKNLERRRIVRNEIIPIQSQRKFKMPLTSNENVMSRFLFVDNSSFLTGDGTFEHPFRSLKDAEIHSQPGDVIYVFPGDGTPRHMDEGIVLKDHQLLASSGSSLSINEVEIPPYTPGQYPTITNIHLGEPVVTNPGKTIMSNFYYMDPQEYRILYLNHLHSIDPSFNWDDAHTTDSPSSDATPSNDSSYTLDPWVPL